MDILTVVADIITMILTTIMCVGALKKWKSSIGVPFYFIFVFLYVLPIFLDYFYSFPDYTYSANLRGFVISHKDLSTRLIYDMLILVVQWLLLNLKIKKQPPIVIENEKKHLRKMLPFVYAGLVIAPVLVLFLGNDRSILYTFMWRENDLSAAGYLPIAEKLSYVGICCAAVLFFWDAKKNRFLRRIIAIIFAYVNVCIEGKRSIIFFLFLAIFAVMLPGIRGRLITSKQWKRRLWGLLLLGTVILVIMVIFSAKVKIEERGYTDAASVYTTIRIDIFRDDRVRMAIFSFVHPKEMTILEYPGQTILPAIISFFPLDYLFGFVGLHPMAYTAYTSAALVGSSVVSQATAFMTPAIFAELVSNFHIIGVALMIMLTFWFIRMAERYPYPANVFILVSYILLQMYSISYIAYFLEVTLVVCLACRVKISNNTGYIGEKRGI